MLYAATYITLKSQKHINKKQINDLSGGGNRSKVNVTTLRILLVIEMFCLLKVPKSQHPSCDTVVQYGKLLTNKYAFPKYLHVLTNRG